MAILPREGAALDRETFITAVFCLADDFIRDLCRSRKLRQRGPAPMLADSEVLTIESVGAFLGLDTDRALHAYFRCHFGHLFAGLRTLHRTTFVRQAANLWMVKSTLWQHLAAATQREAALALIDSLPVPVCRFARPSGAIPGAVAPGTLGAFAQRCRSFRAMAAFGYDAPAHQTYYGLRLHLRLSWPGVITAATLAPASHADQAVAPPLLSGLTGWLPGDCGYGNPALQAELAEGGLALIAPARARTAPRWPSWLTQTRRRSETVLGQLSERYGAKQVRTRDPPGSSPPAGCARSSPTPWPCCSASRPGIPRWRSPSSSPPETRTPG